MCRGAKEKPEYKMRFSDQNITELSGGNQQKVILGKWLAADSQIIIFDEPTKGIDIGSKSEIYTLSVSSPMRVRAYLLYHQSFRNFCRCVIP